MHPTDLELEALRSGEAEAGTEQHAAQCEQCQQRLQQLTELARELRASTPQIAVPAELDQAVLQLAQQAAQRVRGVHRRQRQTRSLGRVLRWAAPLAAAASIALLVTLPMTDGKHDPSQKVVLSGRGADVNADGQVNIVDAMLLARALQHGAEMHPSWDLDGDQRVDDKDVGWIARSAVRLTGDQP